MIKRRELLLGAAASATAIAAARTSGAADDTSQGEPFQLKYAPHPGMFKKLAGDDVIDQIKFAHDQGFRAWEYNGLPSEEPQMQERIGKTLDDLGMTMGVFVAYADFQRPTFAAGSAEDHKTILDAVRTSVDVARRANAKWMTVVPGSIDQTEGQKYGGARISEGYQTANVIDLLRRCAEILEPHDLVMVLEPLNWHANHGGVFLQYSDQAYAICKAVDSPSCKILFDIYHQQITEGNLIPNIDASWEEIAYFQAGDNPGRKEPGTGEINYQNVFRHIHSKGFEGVIGMEHGNSMPGADGERAVIEAYRKADQF